MAVYVHKTVSKVNEKDRARQKQKYKANFKQSLTCTVPLTLPDTPIREKSDINRIAETSCTSEWSCGPGSDQWDILLDEAEIFGQKQMKKAKFKQELTVIVIIELHACT